MKKFIKKIWEVMTYVPPKPEPFEFKYAYLIREMNKRRKWHRIKRKCSISTPIQRV